MMFFFFFCFTRLSGGGVGGLVGGGGCISFLNTARQSQTLVYKRPATPSNAAASCEGRRCMTSSRLLLMKPRGQLFFIYIYSYIHMYIFISTHTCLFKHLSSCRHFLYSLSRLCVFLQRACEVVRTSVHVCVCLRPAPTPLDSN